jgi:predicted ATPase
MRIKRYTYPMLDIYLDGEKVISVHNDVELARVQVAIAEGELEGYEVRYEDHIIPINKRGELQAWPRGMYDLVSQEMAKLSRTRNDIRDRERENEKN